MMMRQNSHLLDYNSIYFQNNNVHSACNIVHDRIPTLIAKKKQNKKGMISNKSTANNTNLQEMGWTNWTLSPENVSHTHRR